LGADSEGLIPARPKSIAQERVQIELQTIFKPYSLSFSRRAASGDGTLM
jgi:hypothetical protein